MMPAVNTYVPDTVIDGWTVAGLIVRGISSRGVAKRVTPSPRQDSMAAVRLSEKAVGFAVADGVSQAPKSHLGSAYAVRYGLRALERDVPWAERMDLVSWALAQEHSREGDQQGDVDVEGARQALASTLVLVRLERLGSTWVLEAGIVGDSALLLVMDGALVDPFPAPDHGAANVTDALPGPSGVLRSGRMALPPGSVVVLASDGVTRPLAELPEAASQFTSPRDSLEAVAWLREMRDPLGDDQTLLAIWIPGGPRDDGHEVSRVSDDEALLPSALSER